MYQKKLQCLLSTSLRSPCSFLAGNKIHLSPNLRSFYLNSKRDLNVLLLPLLFQIPTILLPLPLRSIVNLAFKDHPKPN